MDLFPKDYKKNNSLSADIGKKAGGADILANLKGRLSLSGEGLSGLARFKETFLRLGVLIGGIILILVLLLWGGLFFYAKSLTGQVEGLKKQQSEVFSAEDRELASKIVNFDSGASLIQSLLKKHVYSSVIFEKISATTLPRVQWQNFDMSVKESLITLKGFSGDYATLAKQMLALESDEFSNIKVSSIALDKTGGVTFVVSFNFDPRILQK